MIVIMRLAFFTAVITRWRARDSEKFVACSANGFLPQIYMFSSKNCHFCQSYRLFPYGQRTSGGRLIKIASIFPPVFSPNKVPRSCNRLNST